MIGLATLLMSIIFLMMFYFFVSVNKIHIKYKRELTVANALRNGMIMNLMSHFPYSKFMLTQERDCPICFE